MYNRQLKVISMCLFITFLMMPQAEAGLAWRGFSQLCFEGTFKGGPVTDGELSITLQGVEIQVRCVNFQSGESCQPGKGNAGNVNITVPAFSDPDKEKGVIFANGCISLDKWDHHFLENGSPNPDHQHLCKPSNNTNKIEREGSAHITKIDTEWVLTNTNTAGVTKVIKRGFQTCFWDGSFDENACSPEHETGFLCPIDEEFKK